MNTTGDTSTYRRDTVRTRASPSLSRTVDISALDASLTRRVEEFRQLDLGLRQQVHELRDQLVTADRLLRESERSRAWWKNRVQVLDARCREQERAIRQLKLKTAQYATYDPVKHALELKVCADSRINTPSTSPSATSPNQNLVPAQSQFKHPSPPPPLSPPTSPPTANETPQLNCLSQHSGTSNIPSPPAPVPVISIFDDY
ncbi:hypothetical protein SAICODRAFT_155445 [Saitoella complicata NRRL Y-17804]|uniref:uncharacterized protein n=1 Tax=Saitoella complicata (strain BCRC 22490 / CBS 7301 / JCM 7358 / NBRC 10748 / NRRL Y-17804) TaxID=698492 RepID=UPI000866C51C|nr:uncharacterized protein SAICODRAFT_155445 [Saitoella complicata NRRL Y-17804]ODQ51380.1 hypothetical protein SAICODRAFT_155445 [Saitoella complicata NRRL Y-17804]